MTMKELFAPSDMTVGKPWEKIVAFTIPMLIGNIAQQLYNTVDSIVIGKYVGDNALAAVGSASPILNLLLVLFVGISVGAGVMRGAGDTMTPMWISMVVTVVIRVPLAYGLAFLTRTPELPNGRYQVLWISMLVSWCMGALLTLIFYKKGNWKKKALTGSASEK